MDIQRIEQSSCQDCRGPGNREDGTFCESCKGTSVLAALTQSANLGVSPRQYPKQRRFPRYRTDLPLRVRDHQERDIAGRCRIIAEGGLGALLCDPIGVGSVVQLSLALSTHAVPLEPWAIVRYQIDLQHGFEFISMTEAERLSLRQFCNELATGTTRSP